MSLRRPVYPNADERIEIPPFPWDLPPNEVCLDRDELHLWGLRSSDTRDIADPLARQLSSEEIARAGRYRFMRDRERFVAGRGVLRSILGRYLNVTPKNVPICYESQGKPVLLQTHRLPLQFNLSHSGDLILLAVTVGRPVGIDVEEIRPLCDLHRLAAECFTEGEFGEFSSLPAPKWLESFFDCWTRKEAWLKCCSVGLARSMKSLEVSFASGREAKILNVNGSETEARQWNLISFRPQPGYAAAVVTHGTTSGVRAWSWGSANLLVLQG